MRATTIPLVVLCAASLFSSSCGEAETPKGDLSSTELRVEPLLRTPLDKEFPHDFGQRAVMRIPAGKSIAIRLTHNGDSLFERGMRETRRTDSHGTYGTPVATEDRVKRWDSLGGPDILTLETATFVTTLDDRPAIRIVMASRHRAMAEGGAGTEGASFMKFFDETLPVPSTERTGTMSFESGALDEAPTVLFEIKYRLDDSSAGARRFDTLRATIAIEDGDADPLPK